MAKEKKNPNAGKSPTVLALSKKISPSYGQMFGTIWENRHDILTCKPLRVLEKSLKGTMSNRLKGKDIDKEVGKSNLQRIDTCSLENNQDTLKVSFSLKILGNIASPDVCNDTEFVARLQSAIETYTEEHGFKDLAYRYAYNIACGRFLWRNRVGAEELEVVVKCETEEGDRLNFTFDAKELSPHSFEKDPSIEELAELIANVFADKKEFLLLEIDAYSKLGKNQDVFPSEELILDKTSKDKGKVLSSLNDFATMHSQKLGNAIRTIDTWYTDYDKMNIGPLPIEIYGTVTTMGQAFRHPQNTKKDFYTILDYFAKENKFPSEDTEHYFMAVLIRGGVFGRAKE